MDYHQNDNAVYLPVILDIVTQQEYTSFSVAEQIYSSFENEDVHCMARSALLGLWLESKKLPQSVK